MTGEISVTAEGQSDASLRRMFTGSYKALWKNNLENELLKIAPQAKILNSSFGDDPYNYISGPIDLKISFVISDYATVADQTIISGNNKTSNISSVSNRAVFSYNTRTFNISARFYNCSFSDGYFFNIFYT